MTLRARLSVGLVIIAIVLMVPLAMSHAAIRELHVLVRELRTSDFSASIVLGRLRDALADVRARETRLGILKSDTAHRQLVSAIDSAHVLSDSLVRFSADTAARKIVAGLETIRPLVDREFEAWRAGREAEGDSISEQVVAPVIRATERALAPTEQALWNRSRTKVAQADQALQAAERQSMAALVFALVAASIIAFWLMRSISGPMKALEEGMRAVADGELQHPLALDPARRDEFGRLALSFGVMSRQLSELDKLKAEFVSVASHELKTPINVILGYLQLMQDGIYGQLSAKQSEVLSTVEAQGRTLARLCAHLLDVTRFEAGGGRIEPRPITLATLLQDLERAFHVLAVQRGIDFKVTLSPGLPLEVHWDSDRINEVMGNLLANAFKFTSAGGRVELIASPADRAVRIEVRDTGAGIPPAQLPHIFEKFYQADNQGAASAKGTGLGLAIAKEIVTAHRGEIHCDSTVGVGTTFTLLLPVSTKLRRRSGTQHAVGAGAA